MPNIAATDLSSCSDVTPLRATPPRAHQILARVDATSPSRSVLPPQ